MKKIAANILLILSVFFISSCEEVTVTPCEALKLADLILDEFEPIFDSEINNGDVIYDITSVVLNIATDVACGTAATSKLNEEVRFSDPNMGGIETIVNDELVDIPGLSPQDKANISSVMQFLKNGTYRIIYRVDAEDNVEESDENNNTYNEPFAPKREMDSEFEILTIEVKNIKEPTLDPDTGEEIFFKKIGTEVEFVKG